MAIQSLLSVYTSMRHPKKFNKVLLFTFILTTLTYLSMAVVGYLMYGDNVRVSNNNKPTNKLHFWEFPSLCTR
ncbi:hypothetical protein V2J09_001244 [Rumex salicifolius]